MSSILVALLLLVVFGGVAFLLWWFQGVLGLPRRVRQHALRGESRERVVRARGGHARVADADLRLPLHRLRP